MKVAYVVVHYNSEPIAFDCSYDPTESGLDAEWAAQEAADDYHSNHDGWESSWPLDIALFVDGKEFGVFSVDREARPEFVARRK